MAKGEIKNLLINMPPRYGKTELAVIMFIAWCIARRHSSKFIHLSYSDDLVLDNSAKVRELIRSDEFQELWKVQIKDDADSKKKWYTSQSGGLYATSAGGPITGFGAGSTSEEGFCGAIIIDDPIKVDDIDRDNERARINRRLNTAIKNRRNSRDTPIIIIMQRLHEEDMSGFVLEGKMGEDFHHLKLAAIQPDGKALWPYKHTLEELRRDQKADQRAFAGQMQQEPTPDDGTFFKREWFKRFDLGEEPDLYKFAASDYAVTEEKIGTDPDFTEHGIGGFDKDEDLWFVDWWSGKTAPDVWISEELRLAKKHEPFVWVAEGGIIRRAVEPFLVREQKAEEVYFRLEWLSSVKNKAANARSFQALASAGKVHIPNTEWGEALISQLLKFLNGGAHDDKVDVCGLFGRLLDQAFGPRSLKEEDEEPKENDYDRNEDDGSDEDWRTN